MDGVHSSREAPRREPLVKVPRVGISVIIHKDDKVVLGKRKGSHGAGTWAFPGGHLEFGESFYDCARREVREETGEGLILGRINYDSITNDIFRPENLHYITIFMRAQHLSGEPVLMEPEKCDGWEWFDRRNFPALPHLMLPIQNLLLNNHGMDYLFNEINWRDRK